ncbi:9987_t:CDS:2 [Funneliformis mosseae]|uniref:9987_t:CDS:1 n=1 Tax=Funneliformis mosseae TaxID=27381 RepID=A0A9N9GXC7_FUNMO|nr:9987_t:CDS:2 [Funneliformis mosseae]
MLHENKSRIGSSVIHNYTWIIREFTKIKALAPKPQCFHSPQWTCKICIFDDNGCSYTPLNWRLKVHPNGNSESSHNSISCYLEAIFPSGADSSSRANVNFYIGFYIPVQQGEKKVFKLVKRRSERHDFLKVKPTWGWPNFCSKAVLNNEAANNVNNSEETKMLLPLELQKSGNLVEDDTLVIHVVIITTNPVGILDSLEDSFSKLSLSSQPNMVTFPQTLDQPDFSDIKFLIEGKIINAHQVILAERSHYFKTLIKNDWMLEIKNSIPVKIHDVDYNTFYNILHYLYTGSLAEIEGSDFVKISQLQKIFIDADMRKTIEVDALYDLVDILISELICLINMNTWDHLLAFGWERDIVKLRKAVYRFAKKNWDQIRESEPLKNILRDANVDVTEELFISINS